MAKVLILKAGGKMKKAKNGITMLDEDTMQFNGPSHDNGGIPLTYGGMTAEVEGGETGYKADDGSLVVMGNMTNPLTGRKFKQDSKVLAQKEVKMNTLLDKGTFLVNNTTPGNQWANLKFNAGRIMMEGAARKKDELSTSKEHMATIQQAMLDHANEMGADPQAFSKGTYRAGGKIGTYQNGGQWDYRGTNTSGIDSKISGFINLLQKKGLTGYSGPESGISQRNTKSGHASRHQTGEALDAFLSQPDAYQKVLKDPDLSKYLIDNGLTAINEYDPKVAAKTGATAGHLHIGYDKGTPTSDQFRSDAASMYKSSNPNWGWGTVRNPKGKLLKGAQAGDQQTFPYDAGRVGDPSVSFVPVDQPKKPGIPNGPDLPPITPPKEYPNRSNASPLAFNQILPELYTAATNRVEPVWAQRYQPQLFEPYQVSFQDRRNLNSQTFRAASQRLSDNPEALSTLSAQKYEADNQVNADEFRTNQSISNDITNKNVALLNDAQLKNLSLADTQAVRQSQARSNTKAVNVGVLNSISSKVAQHELENRTLQVYENLYPHYRYDERNNFQTQFQGAPGQDYINWQGNPSLGGSGSGGGNIDTRTRTEYNRTGQLTKTTKIQPSELDTATKQVRMQNTQMSNFTKFINSKGRNGYIPTIGYQY